jgi:hypothetical protein
LGDLSLSDVALALETVESIRTSDMVKQSRMLSLTRCTVCDESRGNGLLCICDGLVCTACGKGRTHRPVSGYYDEVAREVVHVPHFAALKRCPACGERSRWKAV